MPQIFDLDAEAAKEVMLNEDFLNFPQLPKTFVLNAECDTLRDEGFLYAKKCEDFGVDISHYEYQGLIHGFLPHLGAYSEAYDACDLISEFITKLN